MSLRRVLPLALGLSLPAAAFVPPEGVPIGQGSLRVHTYDRAVQSYLARQAPWRAFAAAEGLGWAARFDEASGAPQRAWGPGIRLGTDGSPDAVAAALLDFVGRHAALLGVEGAEVVVRSAARWDARALVYVDLDVLHDGVPQHGGGLTFRVVGDRLVLFGSAAFPTTSRTGGFVLSAQGALDAWTAQGPGVPHVDRSATRAWLPDVVAGRAALRPVWVVRSRTPGPTEPGGAAVPGDWEALVDATTGQLVRYANGVRFLEGQLTITHDVRLGDGSLTTSPLRNATVAVGGLARVTDDEGRFVFDPAPAEGAAVVTLDGPRVDLRDQLGRLTPAVAGGVQTLGAAAFLDRLAGPSSFVYVQQVQDFAARYAPEVDWVGTRARVNVNIDQTCNAWFDGTLNFLREGDGCSNTGRLADVVFHEWGHGFHNFSLLAGAYDGSLGEGAADVMSAMLTLDPRIAPYFQQGGQGELRNVDNRQRYPEDFVPNPQAVHYNGLIFGGSMWSTFELLRDELGDEAARDVVMSIFTGLLKGGPDLTTAYDEAVLADDDDADLSNGTPHQCALVEGFGEHGLGPVGGFGVGFDVDLPESAEPGADLVLDGTIVNSAPDCVDLSPRRGQTTWRVDDGRWNVADAVVDGDAVGTVVPGEALELGDVVSFYSEVVTSSGGVVADPPGGPIRPHTVLVGDVLEIRCDDFEDDDGGYTHRLLGGTEQEGADDWAWGTPIGLSGDPDSAFSGDKVWGNDLGGGAYDGAYQNEKTNELRSPEIPTRHYTGLVLAYRRWLAVEDGYYDRARILADGDEIWTNWATDENRGADHHLDDRWALHVVPLAGAGEDGAVRLAWQIQSDGGLTFGGWNLDDVCLYAPATADNRLGISDLVVARAPETDEVTVSFTQPLHAPVREVRVVRRRGDWPTGPDDGDVVWSTTTPELGAPVVVEDRASGPDWFYAAYASDGEAWLSWTREGFNAGAIDPIPGDGSGCACASTQPGGAWLGLAGLAVVGLRRRAGAARRG